jgi:signal transduction histidine kinase
MMTNLRLTDPQGNVIFNPEDPQADGRLDLALHPAAISLQVEERTVGFLVPPDGTALSADDLESALLERLNRASLNAALLAGGLALVLATLLAYSLLRPVRSLTQAARRLSEGDLSQRVVEAGPDELTVLGRTFNQMADSLQEAKARRQAMTADIAHELRTPLAVQRANLEALQDGVYPLAPENLEPILEQNQLLTRLVGDLRTLALVDAGELSLERRPTDLGALALGLADRFQPQAVRRRVTLQTDLSRGCPPLSLDPDRVEQILSNLLDNALRHTPAGGTITISLACAAGEAVITVRDTGPGIPPEVLPQIFERFFRADRARSRQEGGTGLGLAIARQLAEAHGGAMAAANLPQGGAEFRFSLPI